MSNSSFKLFCEPVDKISQKAVISTANAANLSMPNGGNIKLTDPETNQSVQCAVQVDDDLEDFSIQVASDILATINFTGVEIMVESAGAPQAAPAPAAVPQPAAPVPQPAAPAVSPMPTPAVAAPAPMLVPQPAATMPQPGLDPSLTPMPTPAVAAPAPMPVPQPAAPAPAYTPMPTPAVPAPAYTPMPTPAVPAPAYTPMPTPGMPVPGTSAPGMPTLGMPTPGMPAPGMPTLGMPGMPAPGMPAMGTPGMPGMPAPGMPNMAGGMGGIAPQIDIDPYPNKMDVNLLCSQKQGAIIASVKKTTARLEGKIIISQNTVAALQLFPNALIGWEDPLTRSTGSARLTIGAITDNTITIDEDTYFDTGVEADRIILYSMEAPIVQVDAIPLEVEGKPDNNGFLEINHRNSLRLNVVEGEILAFEDDLTGAFGAGKVKFNEALGDEKIIIDQELLDASGVGSYEVELRKNIREIIPLQSVDLGVSPIEGDNVWAIISQARANMAVIKQWLTNYIIFKGIKLRWKEANTGVEVRNTTPALEGDVLAKITPTTTINLAPTGLVTFNAILIIDISRSMMARDVEVTNIGPALEGIKAAMKDPEIIEFLNKFKPGVNVPRRFSAAFAAILFLSEKVGRGFGEKVSIIRFADLAQTVPMTGGKPWMDASSGAKGELEMCARTIVQQIGNAYGQATNMGPAILKTIEILNAYQALEGEDVQPTMIVLLTDGIPTDGNAFYQAIEKLSHNENIVLYIIGLGNPDDEGMKRAARMCGGEYFKPEDSGELLTWYSKRARDLTVKIRRE